MWFEFFPERSKELLIAAKDFAITLWTFHDKLRRKYSEKAMKEAQQVLEEATRKIEELTKKLQQE
jgi:hypothetical protein